MNKQENVRDYRFSLDGIIYTIPKGFRWDWDTFAFDSRYTREASMVHDWLIDHTSHDRDSVDRFYRTMAIEAGMSPYRAYARWIAIVLFREVKKLW